MSRAAVAFPGRGSYGPTSLGSLPSAHAWVRRADELRERTGLPSLIELDGAGRFEPATHLRPTNAWPLVFLCGLLDAERIADDHEVVVVIASSTGWYTALAASGALGFDDAFRLVHEMATAAEAPLADGGPGAEFIYPLSDEAWQPDPARTTALETALREADGNAGLAVDLGAFAVVGGTGRGVDTVTAALPTVAVADRTFPLRLASGEGWHTPLRAESANEAAHRLEDLGWERPNVTLVDGRGVRFTPWSTDPAQLAEQSLRGQADATYNFAASVRVALREYAPDVILLTGPGGSLGAACAGVIVTEGYRGLRSRAEFETSQASPTPILLSMRR